MKITYTGFALVPKFDQHANKCPVYQLFATYEEAEKHRTGGAHYDKGSQMVVVSATITTEPVLVPISQ